MIARSRLAARLRPSPNFGSRRGIGVPDMLLLHYTGMASARAAEDRLCDPRAEVSCHYLVDEAGEIVQLVSEADRAWHAGAGSWRGRQDVNSRSIGIEIANPGHGNDYREFPDVQISAVIELCADCVERWSIAPELVLAHSDVAPTRKSDPGEKFPWDKLFFAGVGHLCEPAPLVAGKVIGEGDSGAGVAAWQSLLSAYGYGVEISASYDFATVFSTIAFQRHFRPARVDGRADASTVATLSRLLAALNRTDQRLDAG